MTYIICLRQERTCRSRRHATAIAQGFVDAASSALGGKSAQTMLTAGIHAVMNKALADGNPLELWRRKNGELVRG